jgi:serine/threonine protein kinase
MPNKAQDDDLVMNMVELALMHTACDREAFLRRTCGDDSELFNEVWRYVQWEERMEGFLLEPLCTALADEHPFEPGDLLDDRFRIVREVAQGGMGIVYEAFDEKLQRRIALKYAKAGFGKRLSPEVRNATAISHPNVCKTFEIHTASTPRGEIDFLTMELLDGETLAERLSRGPVSEKEAHTIARQLCAGLAEAHRNQVIHGDLKSNNVILTTTADGAVRAVITDFGMARSVESAQPGMQSAPAGGTPDYMAPELWKGERATVASDTYALGVILSKLGSGRMWEHILDEVVHPGRIQRMGKVHVARLDQRADGHGPPPPFRLPGSLPGCLRSRCRSPKVHGHSSCSFCPRISMVKTAEARHRLKPLAIVPMDRRPLRRCILYLIRRECDPDDNSGRNLAPGVAGGVR